VPGQADGGRAASITRAADLGGAGRSQGRAMPQAAPAAIPSELF
jgi:hypothetical protein